MTSKKLLALFGSICLVLVLAALPFLGACAPEEVTPPPPEEEEAPPPARPYVIKMTSCAGPTYPTRVMIEKSIPILEERSGGRLKVDYYPGISLISAVEAFEATSRNIIQISMSLPGYEKERMGLAGLVTYLPFIYELEEFGKHYRDPGGFYDWVEPYYAENGLKLLMHPMSGYTQLYSRTPIYTLEDMKGKLVDAPLGAYTLLATLLGAEATYASKAELASRLEKGIVDASIGISVSSCLAYELPKIVDYATIADFAPGSIQVVANLDWLNNLPPDLRKIIEDTYRELEREHYATVLDAYESELEQLRAQMEVYVLPEDERARWIEAMMPMYDEYAKEYADEWAKFWEIQKKLHK